MKSDRVHLTFDHYKTCDNVVEDASVIPKARRASAPYGPLYKPTPIASTDAREGPYKQPIRRASAPTVTRIKDKTHDAPRLLSIQNAYKIRTSFQQDDHAPKTLQADVGHATWTKDTDAHLRATKDRVGGESSRVLHESTLPPDPPLFFLEHADKGWRTIDF
jgi:hypothetical protein